MPIERAAGEQGRTAICFHIPPYCLTALLPSDFGRKDQLLEICPMAAVRQANQVPEIERLTATNHQVAPAELEQIFSSRCHAEQAKGTKPSANLVCERLSPTRKWWSRTGSNRRHPACKAGALPAELRPLIPVERKIGGPGRT